jgi:hypothetical protein
MSGWKGRLSWPTALMIARADTVEVAPSAPRSVTCHIPESSSQAAEVTSVCQRTCSAMPCSVITSVKYSRSSGCSAK